MNEVSIRINTTRFIASTKGRPSKIREKRNEHRIKSVFSARYYRYKSVMFEDDVDY